MEPEERRAIEARIGGAERDGGVLTDGELETLSDEELVELIVARTNIPPEGADQALTIIRGEIPPGTIL